MGSLLNQSSGGTMNGAFRIGEYLIEPDLNQISSPDCTHQIEPKVMEVLVYLADHAGDVVSKDTVIQALWADTFVTDHALTRCIAELRRLLNDDAKQPRVIQTIAKKGYRLIVPVSPLKEAASRYEILEKLGRGGMAEVYLATDTELRRKVALKFLLAEQGEDETARKRLLREARSAAALDHPYICKIYDTGRMDGKTFIAMEYVEGQTLKERFAKGSMEMKEALQVGMEIAEALEAAHNKGIIHRDIKPSNIMQTAQGHVKVMDFGIAKRLTRADGETQDTTTTILGDPAARGTVPYMSPEQIRGEELDHRTDIFSFGVVLYEMLTGAHPFRQPTPMETASGILDAEPDWSLLPETIPTVIRLLIRRCLQKDRLRRQQNILDARIEIDESVPGRLPPTEVSIQPRNRSLHTGRRVMLIPAAVCLAAVVLAVLAVWSLVSRNAETRRPIVRAVLSTPQDAPLRVTTNNLDLAISPDGRHIIYVAAIDDDQQLYLRTLDQLEVNPIPGTEGVRPGFPIFSPDGSKVAFRDGQNLKTVSVHGGVPVTLVSGLFAGASWGTDGTFIFAKWGADGLFLLSESGGEPQLLAKPNPAKGEKAFGLPEMLPGNKAVLFTVGLDQVRQISLLDLETREHRVLVPRGYSPLYSPTGHIVYGLEGDVWAVAFDLDGLEVYGSPVRVLEDVVTKDNWIMDISFSDEGTLIYVPGISEGLDQALTKLVWVDRQGNEEELDLVPGLYDTPQVSPDGNRIAAAFRDSGAFYRDVWIYDLEHNTSSLLTRNPDMNRAPLWTADGRDVVFSSHREGSFDLYMKRADGTGPVELVASSPNSLFPWSWSADGKLLVFTEYLDPKKIHIGILSIEGESNRQPLLSGEFMETRPAISPDGNWIAYQSDETGRFEIVVRPFPNVNDGRHQVSRAGGVGPIWAPQGGELFYISGDNMMAVSVQTSPIFTQAQPDVLFEFEGRYKNAPLAKNYDISSDGKRFLMIKDVRRTDDTTNRPQIVLVQNWFEELKRLVPTGR